MWAQWKEVAEICTNFGILLVIAVSLTLPFVQWVMLILLILCGLCVFAANRLNKKQKRMEDWPEEWVNLVRAAAWKVRCSKSGIHLHPVSYWVRTLLLLVFLPPAYILSAEEAGSSSSGWTSYWLFGVLLIAFLCSCLVLLVVSISWRDFGTTYFVYGSAFSPGGKIVGRIHFQHESPIEYDLECWVACYRQYSGIDSATTTLHFSKRKISPNEFGVGPTGRRYIPIDFDLPSSALESSKEKNGNRIVWELSIRPAEPWPRRSEGKLRVPYKDSFQLPVFRVKQPPAPEQLLVELAS